MVWAVKLYDTSHFVTTEVGPTYISFVLLPGYLLNRLYGCYCVNGSEINKQGFSFIYFANQLLTYLK